MDGSMLAKHYKEAQEDLVEERNGLDNVFALNLAKANKNLASVVGDWLAEGKLIYKTVQSNKTKLMRGHCISDSLPIAMEFQVFFVVTLHAVQQQDRSIMHLAINGLPATHLPSISVKGGTTALVAHVRHGAFNIEIPGTPLVLREPTQVRFMVYRGMLTFEVGSWRKQVECKHLNILPDDSDRMWIFLSSPVERPARAVVSHVNYYAHRVPSRQASAEQYSFRLPPREQAIMDDSQREIARNRKWAAFDSFFGIFLILNSITIGLSTEYKDVFWVDVESAFLGVFLIEFLMRVFFLTRESPSLAVFVDGWMVFDFVVILFSVFDQWILTDGNLPSFLSALRLLRLLKLAKLVRLIRTFRELALLLEGLILSMKTLMWAFVLMVLLLFAFGVLIVRLVKWDTNKDERVRLNDWTSLTHVMWKLAHMATLDDWGNSIMWVHLNIPGIRGMVLILSMFVSMVVTAFGVVNIVIGIMCQTSTVVAAKQKLLTSAENLKNQQGAVGAVRTCFQTWGERPLFKSDRLISCDEIFEAYSTDEKMKEACSILAMGNQDFIALCEAFEDNGEVEIDGLIEAIGIICLQAYYQDCNTDLLAEESGDVLRPIDALFFQFSLKEAFHGWQEAERKSQRACTYNYDALSSMYNRTSRAHTLLRLGQPRPWMPNASGNEEGSGHVSVQSLGRLVSTFNREASEAKISIPLDLFMGVFLCINAVMQAITSIGFATKDRPLAFSIIDLCLAMCFTVEFICRSLLLSNLSWIFTWPAEAESALEVKCIQRKRFNWVLSGVRYRILPPFPPGAAEEVTVRGFADRVSWLNAAYQCRGTLNGCPYYERVGALPCWIYKAEDATRWCIAEELNAPDEKVWAEMLDEEEFAIFPPIGSTRKWTANGLNDHAEGEPYLETSKLSSLRLFLRNAKGMCGDLSSMMDFLIIFFTLLDALVFEVLRRAGDLEVQTVAVSVLRSVRIFRLFMVLRLLKLLPTLQNLFASLVNVWRTLFWMVMLISLIIYCYAIYMVVLVGSGSHDPALKFYFGGIATAVVSGWQLSSFDHWEPIMDALLKEAPAHSWFSFMLFVTIGLGLMKMVVGVMCESAVFLARNRNSDQADAEVVLFIRKLVDVDSLVRNHLGSPYIPQEAIETAFDLLLRPRAAQGSSGGNGAEGVVTPYTMDLATDRLFCQQLQRLLTEAKLTPELIRKIFDKMDPRHTGFLSVDLLMKGGIMMRQASINKINLFAISLAVREIRRLSSQLSIQLVDSRTKLDALLKDMAFLVRRQKPVVTTVRPISPRQQMNIAKGSIISEEVRSSLEYLAAFPDDGSVQDLKELKGLGDINLQHGTGMVEFFGDQLLGYGTDFRKEVSVGDIMILEKQGKAGEAFSTAVVCVSVLDSTSCRVIRSSKTVDMVDKMLYTIVKMDRRAQAFIHTDGDISLSVDPPLLTMSPRSSQRIFDWRLSTTGKQKHQAWQKRGALWEDYINLQADLQSLMRCEIGKDCLELWRQGVVIVKAEKEAKKKRVSNLRS